MSNGNCMSKAETFYCKSIFVHFYGVNEFVNKQAEDQNGIKAQLQDP